MAAADNSPKSGTNQANGFGVITDPKVGKSTQFKPGQSGNPAGKPKGSKHISTWIQELMEDEEFEATIQQGLKIVEYKGAPIKAIIKAQMQKAINGDTKAFDSLGRYGWSQKIETDVTSKGEQIGAALSAEQAEQLIRARANRSDI